MRVKGVGSNKGEHLVLHIRLPATKYADPIVKTSISTKL
jgi:hypothetical protein